MERGLANNILYIQSGLRSKVKYILVYKDNQFLPNTQSALKMQKKFWIIKSPSLNLKFNTLNRYSVGFRKLNKIYSSSLCF